MLSTHLPFIFSWEAAHQKMAVPGSRDRIILACSAKTTCPMKLILPLLIVFLFFDFAQGQTGIDKNTGNKVIPDFEEMPGVQWKFKAKGPIYAAPVIDGNLAYVGSLDSVLYAVDTGSGTVRWKFRTNGSIRSAVCIDKDRVFVNSGDGKLYGLEKYSGKVLWTFSTLGDRTYALYGYADYFRSSPVVAGGIVYFGSGWRSLLP
jgi:outer membrane protein assembly factor BamB